MSLEQLPSFLCSFEIELVLIKLGLSFPLSAKMAASNLTYPGLSEGHALSMETLGYMTIEAASPSGVVINNVIRSAQRLLDTDETP